MMPRGWPKPKVWRCELSFQGTEPYQGRIYRGEAPFEALDTKRERPQRLGNGCGRPRREKALSRGGLSAIWKLVAADQALVRVLWWPPLWPPGVLLRENKSRTLCETWFITFVHTFFPS